MQLAYLFNQLTHGELSQLSIGKANAGAIAVADYPEIITHVNLGLLALHKRFNLIEKEAILQLYDDIESYTISENYAVNGGSAEPVKYVIDTVSAPFADNTLMKIERIVDENGDTLPFNDSTDDESYYSPAFNVVQAFAPTNNTTVGVIYRASSPEIPTDTVDLTSVDINISISLLTPLLYFVASRIFAGRPALDGVDLSAKYLGMYELSCHAITEYGLLVTEDTTNEKLENNGWV